MKTLRTVIAAAALLLASAEASMSAPDAGWAMLRVGQVAILDSGVSDNDPALTQVCRSLPQLIAWQHLEIESCPLRRLGTRVVVTAIHPGFEDSRTTAFGRDIPFADIRSEDGRWTGTVVNIALRPIMPIGTMLILEKVGEGAPNMYPHYSGDALNGTIQLGSPVSVQVLGQHAPSQNCDLHVRVLSGPQRGRDGWTCDFGHVAGTKLSAAWLNK